MHKAAILTVMTLALAACGGREGTLDEFAVTRNAPLIIPPDYTLEPPVAGTVSTTASDAQASAIEALFGGPAQRSGGEMAVIDAAGADRTSIGARSTAGDPATRVVDKGAETQAILSAPEGDGQDASADSPQ
ncbi:DUF3035 domain-containing protein [Sphingomicrobium nitratireducens]|uniref:DUF3035 domain-containing protein n=1 Tax=Sphingomicrobium nitratireducens TaxID=2964666 RepID=UPI002240CF09|nr:DUF3035 domain-containing protein [Sphingomicrobium nitratireducens]